MINIFSLLVGIIDRKYIDQCWFHSDSQHFAKISWKRTIDRKQISFSKISQQSKKMSWSSKKLGLFLNLSSMNFLCIMIKFEIWYQKLFTWDTYKNATFNDSKFFGLMTVLRDALEPKNSTRFQVSVEQLILINFPTI